MTPPKRLRLHHDRPYSTEPQEDFRAGPVESAPELDRSVAETRARVARELSGNYLALLAEIIERLRARANEAAADPGGGGDYIAMGLDEAQTIVTEVLQSVSDQAASANQVEPSSRAEQVSAFLGSVHQMTLAELRSAETDEDVTDAALGAIGSIKSFLVAHDLLDKPAPPEQRSEGRVDG